MALSDKRFSLDNTVSEIEHGSKTISKGENVTSIQTGVDAMNNNSSTNTPSQSDIQENEFKAIGDQMTKIVDKAILKNIKQRGLLNGFKR